MAGTVYGKIAAVSAALAKDGIAKNRKNQGQNYAFRGIDDVLNALAPLLATHGLVILPRMLAREVAERRTNAGGALFWVTVQAEFDFVSAEDGSKHTVVTFGEAMDSADKATNKAMSAAYKYAAFLAFCIPTEGEDADAVTHTVQGQPSGLQDAPHPTPAPFVKKITRAQQGKFFAEATRYRWTKPQLLEFVQAYGLTSSADMPASRFEEILGALAFGPPKPKAVS